MDGDGYPTYRRRNTGHCDRSGLSTNNQYVVPYNPKLLKIFDSHINVEVVTSIKSVTKVMMQPNFVEGRYVGPAEACDRVLGRPLQNKSHSIVRLPIHLENQQNVTINDDASEDDMRSALHRTNMLLDYFTLNERDPHAHQFAYSEIPSFYVFQKLTGSNGSKWTKIQSHVNVIGRMYSVSPTQNELCHPRSLLIYVKGSTSYESLRTVGGEAYETCPSACLALNLIEDDAEWERAMPEGEVWMMPRQLLLWEKFKGAMSQDLQSLFSAPEVEKRAYAEVNRLLSYQFYQLMDLDDSIDIQSDDEIPLEQHRTIGHSQYGKLNLKQPNIVDEVLNVVESQEPRTAYCYLDGPGGSGKTFVYTTLYHLLRAREKNVHTMAFTGIAAILLPRGKTVHKSFGIPVPIFHDSVSNFKNQSKQAQYLREVDVFLWDEAQMAPKFALELVDRTLRNFMCNDLPVGGKIMILGGDFRQLLPVKPNATRSELVDLSIQFSSLWKHFTIFSLTENMRAVPQEKEFAKYLLSVGDGPLNDDNNNIQPPEQSIAQISADTVDIFTNIINERRYGDLAKVAILSARNIDVDEINDRVMELLDRRNQKIYTIFDSAEDCDNGDKSHEILPEYLHTLNPPNFPPYELELRINCFVMVIRNMSINEGLCNGTRLQVLELVNNLLRCQILTGDKAGEIVFIHRVTLYCENTYPFVFKRRQFPLRPAFAMTINRNHGQTFDEIGIDFRKDVFNHGQLYAAFSRVRSWGSLKIFLELNVQIEDELIVVDKKIFVMAMKMGSFHYIIPTKGFVPEYSHEVVAAFVFGKCQISVYRNEVVVIKNQP
ncbi:uncharacterized protein LOC135164764 [Diachasmimorpha longicaudata]|uniref:uncharacterized protein LOC135164764 n=1 Tax=Diachasmimorpha longicaudata TaxID=58733 RepID=UPI0030B89B10